MMMAVRNGLINESTLKTTSIGVRLAAGAASSVNRLAKAFKEAFGKDLRATDGYRPLWLQEKIFLDRYKVVPGSGPYGDVRWYKGRRYVRTNGAAAAVPGTSNHGLGITVDFASGINTSFASKEYLWMKANAGKYGWSNAEGAAVREPWHWNYDSKADKMKRSKVVGLKVQGVLNTAAYKEWQRQLGVTADGIFGVNSVKKLQSRINGKNGKGGFKLTSGPLKVDGIIGPRTWKAIQKLLNVWYERGSLKLTSGKLKVDGIPGNRTIKALIKSLNAKLWD